MFVPELSCTSPELQNISHETNKNYQRQEQRTLRNRHYTIVEQEKQKLKASKTIF